MVEIYAMSFKQRLHLCVGPRFAIDGVPAGVVFGRRTSSNELGTGRNFEVVGAGLYHALANRGIRRWEMLRTKSMISRK